jgi:hypothetical protein
MTVAYTAKAQWAATGRSRVACASNSVERPHVIRSPEFLDRCDLLDDVHFDVTRILEPLVNARLHALAETIDAKVRERSQGQEKGPDRLANASAARSIGAGPLAQFGWHRGKCQPYWLG